MKKTLLILMLLLILASTAFGVENPWTRKLPFKEGVVSYEISGTMKGSQTVYVKNHGATTAAYRTELTTMMGMTDESRELTLTTPDWVFTVDLEDNTGSKQINPKKVIMEKFNQLSKSEQKKLVKNSEELGIAMVGGMSGTVEKKAEKILGFKCDKVTVMGFDSYIITGTDFPMKVSGSLMGMTLSETATSIDKERVAASKFKIPEGAHISHEPDADRALRGQIDMMFQAMLAGKKPVSSQEKALGDMENAMKAMQQFQENGGLEAIQKQMQGLMGTQNTDEK